MTTRLKVARSARWELRDLIGGAEIAVLAGVERSQASAWLSRTAHMADPFPTPLVRLRQGSIWSKQEVSEWLVRTGRAK